MINRCSVNGCFSIYSNKTTFHRFPEHVPTSNQWKIRCGNDKILDLTPECLSKSYAICGLHFPRSAKFTQGKSVQLQEFVLPTLKLPLKPALPYARNALHSKHTPNISNVFSETGTSPLVEHLATGVTNTEAGALPLVEHVASGVIKTEPEDTWQMHFLAPNAAETKSELMEVEEVDPLAIVTVEEDPDDPLAIVTPYNNEIPTELSNNAARNTPRDVTKKKPLVFFVTDDNEKPRQEFESDAQNAKEVEAERQLEVMSQLCRMCAQQKDQLMHIFSAEAKDQGLAYKMKKFLYVTVCEEDRLPLQVCAQCVAKLEASHTLAETCAAATAYLNAILKLSYFESTRSSVRESALESPGRDYCSDVESDDNSDLPENFSACGPRATSAQQSGALDHQNRPSTSTALFMCSQSPCNLVFLTHSELRQHMQTKHKPLNSLTTAKNNSNLKLNLNLKRKLNQLLQNQTEIQAKKSMVKSSHPPAGLFMCEEPACSLLFLTKVKLLTHMQKIHQSQNSFVPPNNDPNLSKNIKSKYKTILKKKQESQAKDLIEKETKLRQNKLIATQKSKVKKCYECNICDTTFKLRNLYKRHMLRHDGWNKAECDVCHRRINKDRLRSHMQTHVTVKQYTCDLCQRQFKCQRYIFVHMQKVHMKEWIYECTICKEKYKNLTDVKTHLFKHEIVTLTMEHKFYVKKSNFQCEFCNKYSANIYHYKEHLQMHKREGTQNKEMSNSTLKKYQCEKCAKLFTGITNLNIHLKSHSNDKNFQCQYCPSKFVHKQSLKFHEMKHVGDLPYKCTLCPKAYEKSTKLKYHIRKTHLDIRPFSCQYCNKSFFNKNLLDKHVRIHTGDRPFSCQFCQRQFTQKQEMRKHEISHTNTTLYKCSNCDFGSNRRLTVTEHEKTCLRQLSQVPC